MSVLAQVGMMAQQMISSMQAMTDHNAQMLHMMPKPVQSLSGYVSEVPMRRNALMPAFQNANDGFLQSTQLAALPHTRLPLVDLDSTSSPAREMHNPLDPLQTNVDARVVPLRPIPLVRQSVSNIMDAITETKRERDKINKDQKAHTAEQKAEHTRTPKRFSSKS